jgi:hypothetical protein
MSICAKLKELASLRYHDFIVDEFDFVRNVRTKRKDAPRNRISPPSIMMSVAIFGPGHEAAHPIKKLPSPMNPAAIQRTRFLITLLAGRTMQIIATGSPARNIIPTIL